MPKLNWDGNDFRNSQDSSGSVADNISRNGNLQQGYNHGSLTRGLVAYYPMEKGQGQIIHDAALDNIGQIINGASWDSSNFGSSLSFDNSNDALELNESINIPQKENTTLSFWAAHKEKGQGSHATMYSESASGTNHDTYFCIQYEGSDPKLDLHSNIASIYEKTSYEIPFDGSWHHYLVRKEGNNFKVYVDGNKVGDWDLDFPTGADKTYIGERTPPDNYQPIVGKMHEVRVYNRALSKPEIEALANVSQPSGVERLEKSVPGQSEGGISRYKLDGTADDTWGNNHGTNNGADLTATGIYNQAALFSGTGDYIEIPDFAQFSSGYAISYWTKHDSPSDSDIDYDIDIRTTDQGIQLRDEGDGTYFFYHHNGSGNKKASTTIQSTEWTHFVAIWDGSVIQLYKNGDIVDQTSASSIGSPNAGDTNVLGAAYDATRLLDGKIDDVRIYDKALTPLQVERLYHKGAYRISRESTLQ